MIRNISIAIVLILLIALGAYWFIDTNEPPVYDPANNDTKAVVVGAGSSGLTAGYLLERSGFDVTIIEAQDVYGGRMREAQDFADFPIDLGAEWIHEDPSVLEAIVNDDSVDVSIETIEYTPQTIFSWDGSTLNDQSDRAGEYSEYKFRDTTWFSFFERFIVPTVRERIVLSEPVSSIDYSGEQIAIQTVNNVDFQPANTYMADYVIVTVPITVLQNNYISFTPALPEDKVSAINSVEIPDGIKVFIEFSEKFYPDVLSIGDFFETPETEGRLYYDAAFGKDSDRNIMGLFAIGEGATELVGLEDEQIIATILAELDEIYDGAASDAYVKHITQNWSSQEFIEGAYSTDFLENRILTINTLRRPLDDRVFFAGEAMSYINQATVPGAAETGRDAVNELIRINSN